MEGGVGGGLSPPSLCGECHPPPARQTMSWQLQLPGSRCQCEETNVEEMNEHDSELCLILIQYDR